MSYRVRARFGSVVLCLLALSGCASKRLALVSQPSPPYSGPEAESNGERPDRDKHGAVQRAETGEERLVEAERGGPARQVSLESVVALAALPAQLSLGDWRPIGPFEYSGKAFDVAVSPVDPNTVYGAFGKGGGLWKTSDGGSSWLQLNDRSDLASTSCVTVHPRLPDVVVACVGSQIEVPTSYRGLLYSSNGGRHWDFIGPSDGLSSSFYRAVFDPRDPNILYAASEKGVYLTMDRGGHWISILKFPGDNPDGYDQMPDPSVPI